MICLQINRIKTHLPDNSHKISGAIAGGAGGFSVWSPRPPARPPIAFSAIGYYNPAYSLTARSGCPDDWVHRRLAHDKTYSQLPFADSWIQ
jgi:hypothetical protein